jgi:hypothetical protein
LVLAKRTKFTAIESINDAKVKPLVCFLAEMTTAPSSAAVWFSHASCAKPALFEKLLRA